jgi:hypothetical protein
MENMKLVDEYGDIFVVSEGLGDDEKVYISITQEPGWHDDGSAEVALTLKQAKKLRKWLKAYEKERRRAGGWHVVA